MQVCWKKITVVAIAGLLVSACANVGGLSDIKPKGKAFEKALFKEYSKMAAYEAAQDSFDDNVTFFVQRAERAATGKAPSPQMISDRKIKGKYAKELGPAYARLWAALDAKAAKLDGKNAAKAQVSFECWLRQAEKNEKKNKKLDACISDFYGAMAMVEGALYNAQEKKKKKKAASKKKPSKAKVKKAKKAPGPIRTKYFIAFFDFGSSKLSKKAQIAVESAVGFALSKKSGSIAITGHTDTYGSQKSNKALAKKRVASVLAMFKDAGFNLKKDILDVALGEADPAVASGDGRKEARNRRVVIAVDYR
ncbi:MAG: OmpA family protein [Rhodospirillaceae bacterium]